MFELWDLGSRKKNALFEFLVNLLAHFPHSTRSNPPAVKVIALI